LFQVLPVSENLTAVRYFPVTEDVGMPPDQLVADGVSHAIQVEGIPFRSQLGMEDDLKKQVPQFLHQAIVVGITGPVQHGENFVGLLEQVGTERLVGLFTIPWAALRPP